MKIQKISRMIVFLSLVILAFGCSGNGNPVSDNLKGTSSAGVIPSHPVLSNVLEITFDDHPAAGWGYFYDLVKPGTRHVFRTRFSDALAWSWKADDIQALSPLSGTGDQTEFAFIAPSGEKEISIYLDLTNHSGDTVNLRWRINVKNDPVYLEFIHPDYEEVVSLGDPFSKVKTDVVANEFLVTFKPEISSETAIRTIFNMECTVLTEIYDTGIYRVYSFDKSMPTADKMNQFKELDMVSFTQPNYIFYPDVTPNDTYWNEKWDLRIMNGEEAWDVVQGSDMHYIVIIDTGIDRDHPDLAAKVTNGVDFITGGDGFGGETDGDGQDNNGDGYPDQNVGHGTHCAGIAAAISNNGVGSTGVSWNTKLIPLRVFPIDGDSGASASAITGAYSWIVSHAGSGPGQFHIVAANMSYGAYSGYSTQEQSYMTSCFEKNVVMVAACGNSDWDADQHYPSAYDDVMSVAATGSNDTKASFSNYGSTVDISAPGVQIRSTYYNNTYADASGTSMASPEVTGAVALAWSKWTSYTRDEIVDQIKYTADDIYPVNPSYTGKLGAGRVNLQKMVTQGLTPQLEFAGIQSDESKIGIPNGNRDRLWNPDEKINLYVSVNNTGLSHANYVTATIECDNPLIHLIKNSASLQQATRGEVTTFSDPFILIVDKSIPDGTDVEFTITMNDLDQNGPWEFNTTVRIYENEMVQDTVQVSAEIIGPDYVTKGIDDIALCRIDFTTNNNYALIKDFTFRLIGTVDFDSIEEIRIYLDTEGDQEYGGADFETQIGTSSYYNETFFGDFDRLGSPNYVPFELPIDEDFTPLLFDTTGKAVFHDVMLPVIEDRTTSIFVVVDINQNPCPGETIGVGFASAADIKLWDATTTGDIVTGSFPLGSDLREIIPTWVDEKQVTFRITAYTWRAEACVDDLGYVHLVWDENNGDQNDNDYDIGYRRSTDLGATWGIEDKLVDNDHRSYFPDIVATENGHLHVMFYDTPDGNDREVFYMKSTDHGSNWTTPVQITSGSGQARIARMYAEGDKIHAAYHSDRDGSYDIYYFNSTDDGDTFSTPVQVNNSQRESEEVDLVAMGDEVHIVWQDVIKDQWYHYYVVDGRAMYAYSSNGGTSFGSPQNMSQSVGGTYCYHCKIDIDTNTNTVYMVFHSEGAGSFDVYMSKGTGGTMSPAERVTFWDASGTGNPDVCIDTTGRVDLFYDDTVDYITNVWHQYSEDQGETWSTPVRLSVNFSADSQIPSAARDYNDRNLYCFWQDNRSSTSREEVWFNRMIYSCD